MKRLFCGILAGLLLCLTGCGAQPEPEQLSEPEQQPEQPSEQQPEQRRLLH